MREIKFRWFRKNPSPTMYYGTLNDLIFNNINKQPLLDYAGVRNTVMQFTGLLDRNGKEIYEGDVIKNQNGWVAVVEYCDENACFHLRSADNEYSLVYEECEIIGNIHEHPHLMEGGEK